MVKRKARKACERYWRGGAASPLIAVVRPDDPLEWMREAIAIENDRCGDAANGLSYSIYAGLKAALLHAPAAALIALATCRS